MKKILKLYKEEDGIGLTWFVLSFALIIFMAGLAIDGGRLYLTKAELRKAADAAVLSGSQELVTSDSSLGNVVNQILTAHNEQDSLSEGGLLISHAVNGNEKGRVSVMLKKDVPLYFMKLFNFDTAPVSVRSAAAIYPTSETIGTVPFGIDDNTTFVPGKSYTLKVDSGDSTAGNFGILALSGVGGHNYLESLKYGYDTSIKIDQVIDTQTGNIAGFTNTGVQYRIDNSPYPAYDPGNRDDPRLICIMVYTPEEWGPNQIKSVRITGFAYFYITEPMNMQDSTVTGIYERKVGRGIGESKNLAVQDNGAYSAKLVE